MFLRSVFEDAFRAEKFLVILAIKLHFLRWVCGTKADVCLNVVLAGVARRCSSCCLDLLRQQRETGKYLIVDG